MNRREHWQNVYESKGDEQLSWFQTEPAKSLSLVESLGSPPRRVIDVGGGQSLLAERLLDAGCPDVAVLDVSAAAIERAKERLGPKADRVRWIVADVLEADDLGPVDLWHDRAVFHFLTDPADRRRYAAVAARSVVPGGHLIVATFAPTGPEKCSGLPVRRYDGAALAGEFAGYFELVSTTGESHTTPWGAKQDFTYAVMRRVSER